MTDDRSVSLWVGRVSSAEELERCLEIEFTEDGDPLGSQFSRAFKIGFYDDDFREAEMLEADAGTMRDALAGFSSDLRIAAEFEQLVGPAIEPQCNAVVLLFNFKYPGDVRAWARDGVSLRYVGTVEYR